MEGGNLKPNSNRDSLYLGVDLKMASITISDIGFPDLYRIMNDQETEKVVGGRLIIDGKVIIDWQWPERNPFKMDFIF
jgi:hypothetical protein